MTLEEKISELDCYVQMIGDQVSKNLKHIEALTDSMLNITNELLNVSKIGELK